MLSLPFEPYLEELGDSYWDVVKAAEFPFTKLCFRNDAVLKQLGLDSTSIQDIHFEEAFGTFKGRTPFLALRYHGYQFGTYNPCLGDGRGFLYGQLRDRDGNLQDLGTKGSGTTPWSRGGDGRLTLKGGLREIIASEALHRLGVKTSRTLSLIETGESLWRGDEPSPTRSSVMVRVAHTHLRFGTCERLLYLRQPKRLERLLRHIITIYYPDIAISHPYQSGDSHSVLESQILAFYASLIERVAKLAAEWMAAGFVHGVLNTDNMSIAGESFDYGPFAFIEELDPNFTAAYFDENGIYSFGRQPSICKSNLRLLQEPLAMLLPKEAMNELLDRFGPIYASHYQFCMNRRIGLPPNLKYLDNPANSGDINNRDLLQKTLNLLGTWSISYGSFFTGLTNQINTYGLPQEPEALSHMLFSDSAPPRTTWLEWRDSWWNHQHLASVADPEEIRAIPKRLQRWNLSQTPIRSNIENIWTSIEQHNNWEPFQSWLKTICLHKMND